jgi:hypothetical protein
MKTDVKTWTKTMIRVSHLEFVKLMTLIPTKHQSTGTLKAWSTKDELTHLINWLEVFVNNIKAQKNKQALIDTSDYLALNDQMWLECNAWTWQELQNATEQVFTNLESELHNLDVTQVVFKANGQPLVKSLVYELFTHPLHHFDRIYRKIELEEERSQMLERILLVLGERGFSRFTSPARKKIHKYLEPI